MDLASIPLRKCIITEIISDSSFMVLDLATDNPVTVTISGKQRLYSAPNRHLFHGDEVYVYVAERDGKKVGRLITMTDLKRDPGYSEWKYQIDQYLENSE